MLNETINNIIKEDKKKKYPYVSHTLHLDRFIEKLAKLFKIENEIKEEVYFDNIFEYIRQKSEFLDYILWFLKRIEPTADLALKIAEYYDDRSWDIEHGYKQHRKLTDAAIVKIIENFEDKIQDKYCHKGRKRVFSEVDSEALNRFIKSNEKVFIFLTEFDELRNKNARIHFELIDKYEITKKELTNFNERYFRGIVYQIITKCSDRTLYRYDKRFVKLKKLVDSITPIKRMFDLKKNMEEMKKYKESLEKVIDLKKEIISKSVLPG